MKVYILYESLLSRMFFYLSNMQSWFIERSYYSICWYGYSATVSANVIRILLAKTTCFYRVGSLDIWPHFLAEMRDMTECSSALIFISSSNQNCLMDCAGSAIPLVSTTMFLTCVFSTMYYIAAIRSFLP